MCPQVVVRHCPRFPRLGKDAARSGICVETFQPCSVFEMPKHPTYSKISLRMSCVQKQRSKSNSVVVVELHLLMSLVSALQFVNSVMPLPGTHSDAFKPFCAIATPTNIASNWVSIRNIVLSRWVDALVITILCEGASHGMVQDLYKPKWSRSFASLRRCDRSKIDGIRNGLPLTVAAGECERRLWPSHSRLVSVLIGR